MSEAIERFALLVRDGEDFDLVRACLMVAEDAYPDLDIEHCLGDLEYLGDRLMETLPEEADIEERVIALNQFMYGDLGFFGNAEDYYDPRNSYLNDVLDRRTGIPISLGIIYMALGQRIGLELEGVSFPGHFLVRLRLRGGALMLDPFAGGTPLSEDELRALLNRVLIGTGRTREFGGDLPLEPFLEPAGKRQILTRVLRNLKGIHRQNAEPQRLLSVLNRLVLVAPEAWGEWRDRGLVYEELEAFRAALHDLSTYLEHEPEAQDAAEVREKVVALTARCARLN